MCEINGLFFFLIYLSSHKIITDMKKEVTPEIIKRLNDALDAVCKYLTEENYNEVNKFQEEYYRVMSMIFLQCL